MECALTQEQLEKIEENRLLAIKKLQARQKQKSENENLFSSQPMNLAAQNSFDSNSHANREKTPPESTPAPTAKKYLGNIHFELFSKTAFSVNDITIFSSIFKSIPGFKYNNDEKKWIFPLSEYNNLVNTLKQTEPKATFHYIPNSILTMFSLSLEDTKMSSAVLENIAFDLSLLDDVLKKSLLPFQVAGLEFALKRQGRILLADEMGLGKTVQALAIASFYRREWPLLILVPASLTASWSESISRWCPSIPKTSICAIYSGKESFSSNGLIYVISYDLAGKLIEEIKRKEFKVIITVSVIPFLFHQDECHFLRNPSTKRTKLLLPILKKAGRVILLSGTPALSRPIELFTQLQAVNSKLFPNMIEYGIRYCSGRKGYFGWDFKGASHLKELSIVLENTIMIRRLKRDVLTQLPTKRRQQVFLHVESNKLKSINAMIASIDNESGSHQDDLEAFQSNLLYLKIWRETGLVKLEACCEYLYDLLDRDESIKFLIFAHHQQVLDGIEKSLWDKKVSFIRIDGSTPSLNRNDLCSEFQNPQSKIRVAILSLTAAGIGLTLTAASIVLFAELFWNPGILIQAEDRAHRIGQRDSVSIHYLLAQGTSDDRLWPLILRKLNVLESVGLGKNEFSSMSNTSQHSQQKTLYSYTY